MVTTVASPYFVDTNVLIYATVGAAPLHQEARAALDEARRTDHDLWISRQVLREYIATVTRPQSYMRPLPIAAVQAAVVRFQADFLIAEDSSAVTAQLLGLLATVPCGGKKVHDANIVATMLAHDIYTLITANTADFVRFPILNLIPVAPPVGPAPPLASPPPPPGVP